MKKFDDLGIPREVLAIILFAAVVIGVTVSIPGATPIVVGWIFQFAPIWLPILLAVVFWQVYIRAIRAQYIADQEMILLEARIPRDVQKSPRAMELIFAGLHISMGETTFIHRWIKGQVRPWFSFELVSIEGNIHFYIWTRKFFQPVIESQVYAQYPEVELYEVEDYAQQITYDPDRYSLWGCDFELTKEDVLPIKTYVDYELDQDPKEEHKIDPLAHVLEFLSSIGPGEQVWIQILIRTDKDKRRKEGSLFALEDRWESELKEKIEEIRKKISTTYIDQQGREQEGFPSPTPGQTDQVKAIERNAAKQQFNTGIRGIYIAEADRFSGSRIPGLTGAFKQYGSEYLNGFKPTRYFAAMDFPWQEFEFQKRWASRKILDAYRRRSWFHPPYETPYYVLTTEELATIYHFPSRSIAAPGLARIPSTKAEPPADLPAA